MSDDRDRVTAIQRDALRFRPLTGGDETRVQLSPADFDWLTAWALEALDTIDKARELHQPESPEARVCGQCFYLWPCPTSQVLNADASTVEFHKADVTARLGRAKFLHYEDGTHIGVCHHCALPRPCPTWQVLNGGNVSGEGSQQ